MRTPCSLKGTRAASATFVKTQGDMDSPKGRILICSSFERKPQEWPVARKDRQMEIRVFLVKCCRPNLGTDASKDVVLHEHLERRFMKCPVQDAQTQDWS